MLRLVEPPPLADRALRDGLNPPADPGLDAPPLRLVERAEAERAGRSGPRAEPLSRTPAGAAARAAGAAARTEGAPAAAGLRRGRRRPADLRPGEVGLVRRPRRRRVRVGLVDHRGHRLAGRRAGGPPGGG